MKHIVIVEDNPIILKTLTAFLKESFQCHPFACPNHAMAYIENSNQVDLLLLDIFMPTMNGLDFLGILKDKEIDIPVILLTSDDSIQTEIKAFQYGAVDYIKKPVFKDSLILRIQNHLQTIDEISKLKCALDSSECRVKNLEDNIVTGVRVATELRDVETGSHIKRIAVISKMIAEVLRNQGLFNIDNAFIDHIEKAAPFHDIGKIAIPDYILKKPGKLTEAEFEIMKTHTTLGKEAIQRLLDTSPESFLSMAEDIALYHHEKWNGLGYPEGLSKHHIPLSARIVAIADVYDALVSKRVYKAPMSHDAAIHLILNDAGVHFDPTIVNAFMSIHEDIEQMMSLWVDES